MILDIYHAQPDVSTDLIEPLTIVISESMPGSLVAAHEPYQAWAHIQYGRFVQQGQSLADALVHHLPGGTVDQLLRALLQHRASLLRVVNIPEGGAACDSKA